MPPSDIERRPVADYVKLPEVARRLDVSEKTARRMVKAGKLPAMFIGGAYRVSEEDLAAFLESSRVDPGKAQRRSSLQPSLLNGGEEEERHARWDADVQEAQQLRNTARTQMQRALKAWRASKDRSEPYAIRRKHLDEMGALLQKAYDAQAAVGRAYMQAALKQSSDAPLPRYLQDESRAATDFYIDLWRLVEDAGLGIRTNGERTESEKRPTRIEEEAA
jgi:excisionase family DNA binding protein